MASTAAAAITGALVEKGVEKAVKYIKGNKGKGNKPKPKQKQKMSMSKQKKGRPSPTTFRPATTYGANVGNLSNIFHVQRTFNASKRNRHGKSVQTEVTNAKGRILCGTVGVSTTYNYQRVCSVSLNPYSFPNTKLSQLAPMYLKFRFRTFKLEYTPTVGTGTGGSLCFYYQRDPEVRFSGTEGNLSYLNAVLQTGDSKMFPCWEPSSQGYICVDDGADYYVSPDLQGEERLTCQGEAGILACNFNQALGGYFSLYYDIDFWEQASTNPPYNNAITCNARYGSTDFISEVAGLGNYVQASFNTTIFANTGLSGGTVYAVTPTYSLGYMSAFNTYYVSTPLNNGTAATASLYKTYYDAANSTANNRVPASVIGTDFPPSSGISYWTLASAQLPTATHDPKLVDIHNKVLAQKLSTASAAELQKLDNLLSQIRSSPFAEEKEDIQTISVVQTDTKVIKKEEPQTMYDYDPSVNDPNVFTRAYFDKFKASLIPYYEREGFVVDYSDPNLVRLRPKSSSPRD